MAIITLCGSTRFKSAFEEWNVRLTLQGHVVLSIVIPSHAYGLNWSVEEKLAFDEAHLRKIDISHEVFVLDVGGYIGESTKNEIAYAVSQKKEVRYLSEEYPSWDESQCHHVAS
jgi:hypothetical protein